MMVKHAICGQMAEKDEFGFIDNEHESGRCRGSALHTKIDLEPGLRSTKSQLYGKKGTF